MTYTKTKKLTHKRQKICQSGSGNETGDANIDAISDGDPPTPEEMMLDHSEPTLMPSRRLRSQKKASTQIKLRSFLRFSTIPENSEKILDEYIASVSTPYDWEKWYSRWDSKRKESRVKGYKPSADQPARPIKISSTQKIQNQSLTKKRFSNKGVGANKKPYDSSKFQSLLPCTFDLNRISQQGDCKTPKRASCPSENEVLPNWKLMYKNYWGSISPHFGDNALTGPCKCQNKCGADCWNRVIQVECDSNLCSNQAENCTNRVFARYDEALGLNKRYSLSYKIFKTTRRGYGLKTIRPFSSGELIVEYTGDIITTEEMAKILKSDYKDAKNYYFLQIDSTYVIDSGKRGSPARFINHSCSPNSQMEKWNVSGVPRIGLFASENIPAGTEITYDYNFSWFDEDSAQECTCGSKNCRGFINGRFRKSRSSSSNTNSKDKPAVNAAASVVGQKECINAQAAKNTDSTVVVTEILGSVISRKKNPSSAQANKSPDTLSTVKPKKSIVSPVNSSKLSQLGVTNAFNKIDESVPATFRSHIDVGIEKHSSSSLPIISSETLMKNTSVKKGLSSSSGKELHQATSATKLSNNTLLFGQRNSESIKDYSKKTNGDPSIELSQGTDPVDPEALPTAFQPLVKDLSSTMIDKGTFMDYDKTIFLTGGYQSNTLVDNSDKCQASASLLENNLDGINYADEDSIYEITPSVSKDIQNSIKCAQPFPSAPDKEEKNQSKNGLINDVPEPLKEIHATSDDDLLILSSKISQAQSSQLFFSSGPSFSNLLERKSSNKSSVFLLDQATSTQRSYSSYIVCNQGSHSQLIQPKEVNKGIPWPLKFLDPCNDLDSGKRHNNFYNTRNLTVITDGPLLISSDYDNTVGRSRSLPDNESANEQVSIKIETDIRIKRKSVRFRSNISDLVEVFEIEDSVSPVETSLNEDRGSCQFMNILSPKRTNGSEAVSEVSNTYKVSKVSIIEGLDSGTNIESKISNINRSSLLNDPKALVSIMGKDEIEGGFQVAKNGGIMADEKYTQSADMQQDRKEIRGQYIRLLKETEKTEKIDGNERIADMSAGYLSLLMNHRGVDRFSTLAAKLANIKLFHNVETDKEAIENQNLEIGNWGMLFDKVIPDSSQLSSEDREIMLVRSICETPRTVQSIPARSGWLNRLSTSPATPVSPQARVSLKSL